VSNQNLPRIIAHRGGRRWAPENTMAGFRKSVDAGVDGIELDIHRCSTGELVVIHDEDVQRTTNGVGLIKDISYPELQRLSAGLWFDKEFSGERIPLLNDVLDLVAGKCVLNIEIKYSPIDYPGIDDDLIDLLSDYPDRDKLIISAFDHKVVGRMHSKVPDLSYALLADALFVDIADYARRIGATLWHPCFGSLRAAEVAEAQSAGMLVNAWTVNTTREWSTAVSMGLDGIITDDPEGLRDFLEQAAALRAATS
jgi:glycerophosphoryl diester phosphodiesterase